MRPIPRVLEDTDDYPHRRIIPRDEAVGKEPRRRELQSGAPKLRGRICGPDGYLPSPPPPFRGSCGLIDLSKRSRWSPQGSKQRGKPWKDP